MRKVKYDIEELKERIINVSLIAVGVFASILLIVNIAVAVWKGFKIETGIRTIFIVALGLLVIYRKKLPYGLKTTTILLLASIIFLYETIFWGIFSSSELFIILILVFLTGFLNFRQSLIITAVYIAAFLTIGFLFHLQLLTLPDAYYSEGFSSKIEPWIVGSVNLCIVASAILIILSQFTRIYDQTIASLRESEGKYRSLSESANTGIWQVNKDGYTEYVNPTMCMLLEVNGIEDLAGVHFTAFYSDESLEIIRQENYKRLSGRSSAYELVLTGKKGTKRNIMVSSSPLFDENMEITGTIVSVIDITESKKAKQALAESEKKFREMTEFLPQVVFETDVDGFFTYLNKNGQKLFGISEEDLENGVYIFSTIDPVDHERIKNNMAGIFRGENMGGTEYVMINKDKTLFPAEVHASAILIDQRPAGMRGVIIDIALHKKTEHELKEYREHLEQLVKERTEELHLTNEELITANKELISQREELQAALDELNSAHQQLVESEKMASLGILAAGISHEINNPLNFIQGGLSGLEEYFSDHLESHKKGVALLLEGIQEGISRASRIVSSLNHFSRNTESQNEKCDIHAILDNCLVMLQNQLKHKISVKKNYTRRSFTIYGNEGKLHQAFLNILLNSCQAIQDTGIISLKTEASEHDLFISISDTGCGIKPDDLPRIFDPFFTTKAPGYGTGLGLSITYRIIREHRGEIEYRSLPGEGTTALIKLPKY
jgi:PAS domain S-box-containing protein